MHVELKVSFGKKHPLSPIEQDEAFAREYKARQLGQQPAIPMAVTHPTETIELRATNDRQNWLDKADTLLRGYYRARQIFRVGGAAAAISTGLIGGGITAVRHFFPDQPVNTAPISSSVVDQSSHGETLTVSRRSKAQNGHLDSDSTLILQPDSGKVIVYEGDGFVNNRDLNPNSSSTEGHITILNNPTKKVTIDVTDGGSYQVLDSSAQLSSTIKNVTTEMEQTGCVHLNGCTTIVTRQMDAPANLYVRDILQR